MGRLPGAVLRLCLAMWLPGGIAVTDVAAQTVTLSVPEGTSVSEGAGSLDVAVTATLSGSRGSATTITLSLGGTAQPSDYTVLSLPDIEIAAGDTTGDATLILAPVDDNFWEIPETVEVTGSADGLMVTGASFRIDDNETEPTLTIAPSDTSFREGESATNVTIAIGLDGALLETDLVGQVDLQYHGGLGPADFIFAPSPPWSFTVPAGHVSALVQVAVTPVDDTEEEENERSSLIASAPIHATALESRYEFGFSIVPSDRTERRFFIQLTPNAVQSGVSTKVTVRAGIFPALDEPLSFTFRPSSSQSSWFSPSHRDVTVAVGETGAEAEFTVAPPALDAATTTQIYADFGAQEVFFDDFRPTSSLTALPTGVPELIGLNHNLIVTAGGERVYLVNGRFGIRAGFSRTFALTGDAVLSVHLDSGVVRSAPCTYRGQGALSCEVSIQNGDYDFDATVQVAPGGLSVAGWSDRDDPLVTWPPPHAPAAHTSIDIAYPIYGGTRAIDLRLATESVQEGAGATSVPVIARDREAVPRTAPLEVPIRFTDSTTTAADYTVSGPQSITIPVGQIEGRAVLMVTAVDDSVKENPVETVRIEGVMGGPVLVRGVDLKIIDSPSIALSVSSGTLREEGGAQSLTVTAALGDPTDSVRPRPIPVTLGLRGTAVEGDDFTLGGERVVTIPANARSASETLTLTPVDDRLLEMDETIELVGSTPGLTVSGASLTLLDDEVEPEVILEVDDDTLLESETGGTSVQVTARLAPEVMVSADVVTTLDLGGSATAGSGGDYTASWSLATPQITIPQGTTTGSSPVTLTLAAVQDALVEGDETVVVEGVADVQNPAMDDLVVQVATIVLGDDDVRGVVVEPRRLEIDEGDSGEYTVRLTAEPSSDVTVAVNVPSGVPLEVTPTVLTFTTDDWSMEQSVTVTVEADADAVMHEDVELTHDVGGGGYDGVTAVPVSVTLTETTVPQMAIADASADEESGSLSFEVTIDAESSAEVRGSWSTSGVTATAGADYTESSGTVAFAPGTTAQTVTVPILSDELDEEDETLTVTLSAPEHAELSDAEATGTIEDDDDPAALSLSGPSAAAREGEDANLSFTVTLSPASGREVSVSYATEDGTAVSPGDYTASAADAALTFAAGETEKTVTVPVIDDSLDEADEETFTLRLSDAQGATLTDAAAEGTIEDDDEAPELDVEDVTASEDAGGLEFTVALSAASGREVTVEYATSDGTASEPDDYASTSGTLTFPAGDTALTVAVPVVDDALDEEDETLTLRLSGASGATLAGGGSTLDATGTIEDDDVTPTVTVSDVTVSEASGPAVFTVTLDVASGLAATVGYATSDGTAESPDDYASTSGTLTFPAGDTALTVEVPVVDDGVDEEEEEEFTLTLSGPSQAVFAEGATTLAATGTIVDDDDPAVGVSFGSAEYTAAEGGSAATVTVQIDADPERELTIPLTVSHEDGATVDDYGGLPSEVVFTAGGALFQTFELAAVDDAIDDDGESLVLGFGTTLPDGVTPGTPASATVALTDDDERGVEASVLSLSVDEGATTSYTVVLESKPTADVTVTLTGSDGTDLTSPSEGLVLTFTPDDWVIAQTVTVTAADDTDVLADAPVELVHTVAGGDYGANAVSGPVVTVTIVENDTATLSVMDASAAEGAGEVEFAVTLSEASTATVTVDYATSDGTAVAPDDYASTSGTLTFTVPETTQTIRVPVEDDTVDEEEAETFTLTLSNLAQAGLAGGGSTLSVTGTIADDDDPAVAVSFGSETYTAAEGGAPVTVTVRLDRDPEREVVVPLTATPGDGAVAADFSGLPSEVVFTAGGELSRTFAVTAVDDAIDDDGETVRLEFGTLPERVTAAAPSSATVTVTDEDERGVEVSTSALTIDEGEDGSYTVVLGSEPTATVTVTIGGSTNTHLTLAPSDLTLTFTADDWALPQSVTVTPGADADAVVPPAVELTHTVTGGDYGSETAQSVTVHTVERTVPGLTLSPPAPTVSESVGGTGQRFTVSLNVDSSAPVTVDYATGDGTALAGADYTPAAGTLTFLFGGSLTQSIDVPILDDLLDEDDETFTLTLADAEQATVASGSATVTVTDDDALPEVNLPSGFLTVNEGAGTLAVTVSLSAPSGRQVQVDYASSDGGVVAPATAGEDYGAVDGTLTFAAGLTSQAFSIAITDDVLDEGLFEQFTVRLRNPVNAVLGSIDDKTLRINDDDDEPRLDLSPAPSASVDEGGAVTFTVSLSAPTAEAVNVTWETSDGTAVAPGDYTAAGGRVALRIPAGDTSRTFLVSTTDDALDEEESETFGVRVRRSLSLSADVELGDVVSTVTIADNDDPPALRAADATAREDAGSLAFTVSLDAPSAKTVTVGYAVTGVTATPGEDYTAVAAGTLTFPAETTEQSVSVPVLDDAVHEPDETLRVTLSGAVNATLETAQATGTITDDEALPVVTLGPDPASIGEAGGPSRVTASLSGLSSEAVTVTVSAAAVSPAVAGDFTRSGTTLTIAAGSTASTGTVTVTAVDNQVDSPDKTVTIGGTATGGLGVADPSAQELTITDDEETPVVTLSLSPSTIAENGGSSTVTASLSGLSSQAVTVEVSAAPEAGASAGDFTQSGDTLTIAAGSTVSTGTVTLTAVDNVLDTADKTVAVTGTVTGGSAEAPQRQLLTIADDEELMVAVTAAAASVVEGGDATFTVALTGGTSTAPVAVTYTTGGTATSGTDYTAPSGTLTLGAGSSSGTIAIRTLDDGVLDRGETLSVTLSGATTTTGAVTASAAAAVTTIDDQGSETVSVTAGAAVTEGGSATFTVSLSGRVSTPVALDWSTSDGTAVAGSDYTAVPSGTVTFASESTASQTLTVETLPDTLAEAEETFTLTLAGSSLPGGVSVSTATATGRIADDETLMVSVTGPSTVVEGGSAAFPVTVTGGTSTAAVVVSYTTGGTATSGTDYTAPSGTLTLGSGASSGTITIQTLDDDILDRGETLSVTLSAATTTAGSATADSTPAETAIDDRGTETVSVTAGGAVAEGSAATFTVTLSGPVSSAVELSWSTSDMTATAGSDYTAVSSGMVTFAAGTTASQTLTVSTRGDALAEDDETFTVTLTGSSLPDGVSVSTATATGTITDDDALTVSVTGPSTVAEGSDATYPVTVTGGRSTAAVVVSYTVGGTASAGTDYTAPSGTLTLGAGASSGTITIATLDDGVLDRGETVSVTLSGATTDLGEVTSATGTVETTIVDQGTVTVSVTAGDAVAEGSAATFAVSLSGAVASAVTLGWSTSDVTATAGSDYTAVSSGTVTFPANTTTSRTLTVSTRGDSLAEDDETFTVALDGTGLPDGVSLGMTTATGTITDDDALTVSVRADASSVTEGGGATFTVSVTGGESTAAVAVTYMVGGTATSGTDYTAPSGTLTLDAGDSSGTITIATLDDSVLDRGETVSVTLTGATTSLGEVTAGTAAAETTIIDPGTVTVSVATDGAVTEGSSSTFTVTLSGAVASAVELSWSTSNGTAAAGSDYTAVSSGAVTFAADSTASRTLSVSTLPDTLAEGDETFTLRLSGSGLPAGVSLGTATATGTITDDETLSAAVTADAATVVEGSAATFTVTLTGGESTAPVTVTYTVAGTATSGTDYTAPSGTLTLGAGAASGTITIATRTDTVLDGGETLSVTLSGATTTLGEATAQTGSAETTISDTGTVTVSVASAGAVAESAAATFTVTLSGAVSSPVEVGWSTSDVTATAGADYTAASGTVTFTANSTAAQTLTVSTLEDTLAEGDETFTVTLSGSNLPAGVSLGTVSATATITDDDALSVSVTADETEVQEGAAATFTVSVAGGGSTAPVAVTYTVGGTATSGTDYTAPSGTLTLGTGASSGTITVATLSDAVLEPVETVTVTLSGASTSAGEVTAATATAQTEIVDPGTTGVSVTVSVGADVAVIEGVASTFEVSLSGTVASPVTVNWSTSAGTATAGSDYTAVSSGTVTFAANSTASQTLTVSTLEDTLAEEDETFTVMLSASDLPAGVGLGRASATGTIVDDEALTVSVSADAATVVEGGAARFTVSVDGGESTAAIEASYTVGGTASAGTDYTAPSGTLTLGAGASSGTITIATLTDSVLDGGETVSVRLSGASTSAGQVTADTAATAQTTISDTGTVSVSVASDGAAAEGSASTFTVSLSGPVSSALTVGWSTSDVTATAGSDYVAVSSGTVTFPAKSTASQTLTVFTRSDVLAEDDETFTAMLSSAGLPAGVSLGTASATGTITDDDPLRVSVRATASTVAEGNDARFPVSVTGGESTAAVAVTYTVSGTASAGTDYTAPSGTLTLGAGASSGTITITTLTDSVLDPGETVSVTLTEATTAVGEVTADTALAETTIADTGTVSVSVASDGAVAESESATFTVTLSGAVASPVEVGWSTSDVTATAGEDYAAVSSGTVTFPADSTASRTLTVSTLQDTLAEGEETFTVSLSSSSLPAGILPGTVSATGTISDDDALSVSVTADAETVVEGGAATFTVAVSGGESTASVQVTYTVGGTAASGTDYTAPPGTVSLAAGASSGTITIVTLTDSVLDGGETVSVTLTDATTPRGEVTAAAGSAETAISDTGTVTVSVASAGAVAEGESATFEVTLSGAVSSALEVGWSTSNETATAGADYTAASGTLSFAADSTASQTLTVSTRGDDLAEDDETFTVTLTASNLPDGVLLGTVSATGTITDDDALSVSVTADAETVVEGSTATFTVSVTGGTSTAPVEVTYALGGTASAADYTAPGQTTLTLGAGSAGGTIRVPILSDTVLDPGETLSVTLTGASTSAGEVTVEPAAAETTIADGGAVTVSVTAADAVAEGEAATFTVTLSGQVSSAVEVDWSTADETATAGDDYTAASGTLTFEADSTAAQTLSVSTRDDTLAEDEETFTVTLSGSSLPAGVSLGTSSATGTITDDDALSAAVSADAETVVEGNDATFTVALTGGESTADVEVTYTVSGTATAGTDYTAPSGTLTLDAGASSGTITVATLVDTVLDGGETLSVTLSGAGTAAGEATAETTPAQTTITDSGMETVSVASDGAVTEGERSTFTVTLSGAVSSPVELGWSTSDGTATAGLDYTAVSSGTLTFAADATASHTLTVSTHDDTLAEGDETFTVTLTGPSLPEGVSLGTATAEATITDDEAAATEVTLSVAPESVAEDGGETDVTVTATLNGAGRSEPTALTVSVAGDTASDDDFAAVDDFVLTVPADSRTGTASFTLRPADDAQVEGPETLAVTATTDATGLTVKPAELTIADDDMETTGVTLSVEPSTVDEGAGETEIRVRAALNGVGLSSMMTVTVTVAEDEERYAVAPASFELQIPEGDTIGEGTFLLTPVDDGEDGSDRQVPVNGETNRQVPVTGAVVTIRDDDASNDAPDFERNRYTFDLPENRSGRDTPLVLGTVAARDADGERLRYALLSGDRDRFAVTRGDGTVSYIGEGEDFEEGPAQYELTVAASDGEQETTVEVVVRVVDGPEAPSASDDRAETPEDVPKVIDVLSNDSDPDGDRLRVSSVSAPEHGTATVVSRRVRYAPDLNWYGEDRFTYTVADPGGLTSKATVRVKVTPVNDPPVAVDDEVETLEDVPAVFDVLANDSDVDGDPLEVVAVGAAAHATTTIAGGGVRYASELNWYGTDRFTYTIADPEGLTDEATVTVTVLPVNDAPEAVGVIPDQALEEGGAPATVDLTPYFTDVDGDVLTYEAVSSDETAVTVSVSGATLTLSAVVAGTATVTVTAADVEGLTATQTFGVTVGDRLVRGVLTDTLAALGRGHLSSARLTIGRRLETGGGGMTRMMLAGQHLSLDAWERMGGGGLEQSHELLFRAATLQQRRSAADLVGTSADPRLRRPGAAGLMGGGFGGVDGGGDRMLQGTDVLLSFGGQETPAGAAGGGGRWTVWGQGDLQSFRGEPAETEGYDGNLRTAYLGVDARVSERWLAGVAVAQSGGGGNWRMGASSGRLATELTVAHPYVRWADGDTAVWALAGVGRGTAENVRALTGRRGDSRLSLGLGLVEGRRRLATTGRGLEVDLRAEASWARLRTGDGEDTVDGLEAGVRRVRTGVEVTLPLGGPGGLLLAPFGAVSTRHDGGAGQTGVGLELAGGVRMTGGRVRLEAQGRTLALHTATQYQERGVSVTASVGGGQYEPGLTASVRPRWGAPGMGAESLWQDQFQPYALTEGRDDGGVDARVGYGMRLPGGRLVTPFGGYGQMGGSGQRVQVGANLGMLGLFSGDLSSPVQVEFMGERYTRPGGGADHRITLFGIMNFGARKLRPCEAMAGMCAGAEHAGTEPPEPPRTDPVEAEAVPPAGPPQAAPVPGTAAREAPGRTVAVLPFANLSGEPADDWIGTGVAETLATALQRLGAVEVVVDSDSPAGSARRLGDRGHPSGSIPPGAGLPEVHRRHGAAWLATGEYRRLGERIRIVARLIDTRTGRVAASVDAEGDVGEVFALQDRIERELAEVLVPLAASS